MDKAKEVEMELKPFETMCEQTTEHLKMLITGSQEASADEILAVAKTLGEIVDIKKDMVEMCYKKQIMTAMEENADDYGDTWDEDGRKFYRRMRDSKGRYMRGYSEPMHMSQDMRDMDKDTMQRMYTEPSHVKYRSPETITRMYTEPMHNESKFERTRREYTESKMANPEDKQMHQEKLNKSVDALAEEFKNMLPMMDSNEKTMVRSKLTNLANSLQ